MTLSDRMTAELSGSSLIRAMFEVANQVRAEKGADAVVDLSLGNPMAPPPSEFFESLLELAKSPCVNAHAYNASNAGLRETREAIAAMLQSELSVPITAHHLLMSCGAAGALNVIFRAILDPEDEVIILAPYFSEYPYYIRNFGGNVRIVPTDVEFQPNIDAIRESLTTKTKAVIINTPNNPTGEVYSQSAVENLGSVLREHEIKLGRAVYLVSDEPYIRLLFDGVSSPSVFTAHKNAILVRSFSKDLSLAGERIGYIAVSPYAENPDELVRGFGLATRILGFVNATTFMQRVVQRCLTSKVDLGFYQRNRDLLYEALLRTGYEVRKPHGAFYLFPRCLGDTDDLRFCARLQERGLFTVPGRGFGWPGYFRLSCAVPFEAAEKAAKILAEVGMS